MPFVQINVDKIKEELKKPEYQAAVTKIKGLKKLDFWPFDKDGDEYEGVLAEMKHNGILLWEALEATVVAVETASKSLGIKDGGVKLQAAINFLDDIIRLPALFEWMDDIVLAALLSLVVGKLNQLIGHDWIK